MNHRLASHSFRRRIRIVFALVVIFLVALAVSGGCNGGQASGESHFGKTKAFLRICDDGQCTEGDTCTCAVCTVECEAVDTCRDRIYGSNGAAGEIPDNIVCRAPQCGENVSDENTPGMGSVCDVSCTTDEDCAFLDENHDGEAHFCNAGLCRTLEDPEGTPSVTGNPSEACPAGMLIVPSEAVGLAYCLDETEVTVAAFEECVTEGDCAAPTAGNFLTAGREGHPIHFVDQAAAEAYCAFRGARLPTIDEWTGAARGEDAFVYPWGDEVPTDSDLPPRVCALDVTNTCEVGQFPAGNGPYGHADLAGNVAEVVATEGGFCAAGGGFDTDADGLTATSCVESFMAGASVGFRCAKDL